jgi:predicted Zn-dependent peptidase
MKPKRIITVLIAVFIPVLGIINSATAKTPADLRFSPLLFEPSQPEKRSLSNGMEIYLLEDRELPLVTVDVLIKTGTLHEPQNRVGLYQILVDVMRTGGTRSRTPERIDEELEGMAADVEITLGTEYGIATLDVLAEDIEHGVDIFADILKNPLFRQDRLELRKAQEIESIRRRNDEPFDIAIRFFPAYLYGRDHPLGSYEDVAGIQAITAAELNRAHNVLFHPDRLVLAVTGDFKRERIIPLLEDHFADWESRKIELTGVPEPKIYSGKPAVLYVQKNLNQSSILLGHVSLRRAPDNTDIYAIRVMNEILGESSFTSRLFREVREKRGLAYSVGSYFDTSSYAFPGNWFAFSQTRAAKTVETTLIMIDVIESMKRERVTDDELELIKDSITNSFVFGFTNSASITRQRMILDFRGYPDDYLQSYTKNIEKVTAADVQRVARKYLKLDHLIIVIVGNDEYFEQPLSTLGEVITIDPED